MKKTGFTFFEPIGIRTDYPVVDLENKRVTARILHKDKILMTVHVDVQTGILRKEGTLAEVAHLTTADGIKIVDEEQQMKIIQSESAFFIQNGISNPKVYYEELLKKQ